MRSAKVLHLPERKDNEKEGCEVMIRADNDNSTTLRRLPDGRYLPDEGLPFYSGWEVFKQEMRILWLKLTGRLDDDD
jgi:hypothetical protein